MEPPPHDAVGVVLGDPLHFVRTAIAQTYDRLLDKIFARRNTTDTQPVSPSLAIPLLRSAYDESRPELQQLWTELIAAAMDPNRSGRVRLSFIDTLKRFDPLDALLLRARFDQPSELLPNAMEFFAHFLNKPRDEILLSVENLESLRCVASVAHNRQNFMIAVFGRGLISVCVD